MRRLAERFGAILPARFGEVFADEAGLAARLTPREREVAEALALVRGCVQMTLRSSASRSPPAESGAGPRRRTGRPLPRRPAAGERAGAFAARDRPVARGPAPAAPRRAHGAARGARGRCSAPSTT